MYRAKKNGGERLHAPRLGIWSLATGAGHQDGAGLSRQALEDHLATRDLVGAATHLIGQGGAVLELVADLEGQVTRLGAGVEGHEHLLALVLADERELAEVVVAH